MDQIKIGAFIARLRKEKGWTQEELGERLGVTNKTVSRWENGDYMPGVEALTLMGREFGVSLNELIEGRRLESEEDFRTAADEKLADALQRPGERLRRWLERYGAFPAVTAMLCAALVLCLCWQRDYTRRCPMDEAAMGNWCTDWRGTAGEYLVFAADGKYYRYRQCEPLEYGSYTADGPLVTVETGERRFQALIKGRSIYLPDGEGKLTGYEKSLEGDARVSVFINVAPEDFEE